MHFAQYCVSTGDAMKRGLGSLNERKASRGGKKKSLYSERRTFQPPSCLAGLASNERGKRGEKSSQQSNQENLTRPGRKKKEDRKVEEKWEGAAK